MGIEWQSPSWGTPALLRFLHGARSSDFVKGGRVGSRGLKNIIFDDKMTTSITYAPCMEYESLHRNPKNQPVL